MLVSEFSETCQLYKNFQIWEIENMEAFFEGNGIIPAIFKDHYGFSVEEFDEKRNEIQETNLEIISTLLKMVDDKSFFVFTLHDQNHLELVKMQNLKIMNFGVDINEVKGDCVYVVIMDKNSSVHN